MYVDDFKLACAARNADAAWKTTRAQLRRVRENDELRNLQRKLRDENDELRARLEAAQVALLGFDGIADMPLPGPLGL